MMYLFQLRRGVSIDWASKDTVLMAAEPGYELDTGRFKIGDGSTPWSELDYFTPSTSPNGAESVIPEVNDHIVSETPHPVYDDGPSLMLLYQNAKV